MAGGRYCSVPSQAKSPSSYCAFFFGGGFFRTWADFPSATGLPGTSVFLNQEHRRLAAVAFSVSRFGNDHLTPFHFQPEAYVTPIPCGGGFHYQT